LNVVKQLGGIREGKQNESVGLNGVGKFGVTSALLKPERDHSAMPVGGKLLLKGGEALTVEKKIKKKKKPQAEAPAEGEEGGSQASNHALPPAPLLSPCMVTPCSFHEPVCPCMQCIRNRGGNTVQCRLAVFS
jgi:hypothetical protein